MRGRPFQPILIHRYKKPAAVPAAQNGFDGFHGDAPVRQEVFQNVGDALPGALAVGRVLYRAGEHLRADALGIAHFINPARLNDFSNSAKNPSDSPYF